jgi:hypothetical protein
MQITNYPCYLESEMFSKYEGFIALSNVSHSNFESRKFVSLLRVIYKLNKFANMDRNSI